jgi:deoxyribodipyrimidine photolyase-like uncharacterized protein
LLFNPKPTEKIMSKTYFKLDETTRKVVEITVDDYLKCHGFVDTMVVAVGEDKKRKITADFCEGTLSEFLAFLSKVR